MAYSLVATEALERDYDSALARITYALGAPKAAARVVEAMDRSIARIADNPLLNAISAKPTLEALGYREEFVGDCVMLYTAEASRIVVKRLFHMSRDYNSYV